MGNHTMFQYFEWYLENDGQHWKRLKKDAKELADIGITALWIPPAYKAIAQGDVGYATYDLYDLGEFHQKGTVRTKYGAKEELKEAIKELHSHKIQVYLDAVLNHKAGADKTERFMAEEVNPENRMEVLTEPYEIEGWTSFLFPGRGDKYSDFKWNWCHFTGTDINVDTGKNAIYRIIGEHKSWSEEVDKEFGNYDYLMFADIDYEHPEVYNEIIRWGAWVVTDLELDGFRLDAIKHIKRSFIMDFLTKVREAANKEDLYVVAEYWVNDIMALQETLEKINHGIDLFDVALHYKFHEASKVGKDYDLSTIFQDTLVEKNPIHAVTFVENHDSQLGQSLESWVEDWFKPLAYGMILLWKDGYPCVFYGDYYGIGGENPVDGKKDILDKLLYIRKHYAYGDQTEYLDHPNVIGWVRNGDIEFKDSGCAVIISNGDDGEKLMHVGEGREGDTWVDYLGGIEEEVIIGEDGCGLFKVKGGSISVWIKKS